MSFFEIPRPAKRRSDLARELPQDTPVAFEELARGLDCLPDPHELGAEQRFGALAAAQRLINQLNAYQSEVAGVCDTHADAQLYAAGTTGTMVAALTGLNPAAGSGMVAQARALRTMPHTAAAYRAGCVSGRHVAVLVDAAAGVDGFAHLEEHLVTVAAQVEPGALAQIVAVLIEQSRPEDLDDQYEGLRDRRGVSLNQTSNGLYKLHGYLDRVAGQRLAEALAQFTDRARAGDPRGPKARRADALDDLVSAAMAHTGGLGVSGVTVLVDADDLPDGVGARLGDGTVIGPELFARLTCTPICTVILGQRRDNTFIPLAMGRKARRATAGQWAALTARDRGCVNCGRPPRFCEAHHVIGWAHGGKTAVSNMALLCSRCHHDLHAGRLTLTMQREQPVITTHPSRRRRR